ncbi:MAG: sulfatase-like hydrolase/transferase, partial [Pseudomonadota bacterium]|nr:sulfatase-like hydrolase/transferase [Pseudomonadota bacterium]
HLNAEEEPENRDYPGDMVLANGKTFREQFGPRGVLHTWANADGTQKIEDTGPLTKKRMETVDEESLAEAKRFIREAVEEGVPFFVWWNGTRMHFRTHVKEEHTGIAGPSGDTYHDGMVEHDMHVGELLDLLDELGIADNTVVMYSTDNGPHFNTWPDAGTTPFRSEKNSNWEGAYRVPTFVRWPGVFQENVTLNGIVAHEDWLPTFAAIAGASDIKEQLLEGVELGGRTYRNYIDGYDLNAYLKGETDASPRHEFWYVNDDGQVVAARYDDWKVVFLENRGQAFGVWQEPFTELRVPAVFNLRRDPFEKAQHNANIYFDWLLDRAFVIVPIQALASRFLQTMQDYPPSQTPGSFNLSAIEEKLKAGMSGSN